MARQSYNTNPAQKHLSVFNDFSRGINSVDAEEQIDDRELMDLVNKNIDERGKISRRHGMSRHITVPVEGKGQGYFRFYRAEDDYDEITAVGGRLYKDGVELPITNLSGGFQTIRPIEAVQFGDFLFIATGTKLVEYDGTEAKVVDPYTPKPFEAMYIGTNSLADDPFNFMTDGLSSSTSIEGVTFDRRYGIIHEDLTLTAYVNAPSGQTNEFKFEYRLTTHPDGFWELAQDWSTTKTFTFKPEYAADYQFRVWVRPQGNDPLKVQYIIPKYVVKPHADPDDTKPWQTIHQCNRILLHWNQLVIYGDPTEPDYIYVSHLNKPRYFPIPNTLAFQNELKEALTCLVQYRDMVVAFTDTSIQALFGKFPQEFRRVNLHKGLGCIAPFGATVMENHVAFLSREGIYVLKSVYGINDRANVERIDDKVRNHVTKSEDVSMLVEDSQLRVVFPSEGKQLRYYYKWDAWTKDESTMLDFDRLYARYGDIFGQSATTGHIRKFDSSVWDDEGYVYKDVIETKYFDFGQPHHRKKLKELIIVLASDNATSGVGVYVYADSALVVDPTKQETYVDNVTGEVSWSQNTDPNLELITPSFETAGGTALGDWEIGTSPFGYTKSDKYVITIFGNCRASKVILTHEEAKPLSLLSIGYVFKTKKPT